MAEMYADYKHCSNCHRPVLGDEYLTEINPPGGYGREQVLVCDVCMDSDDFDYWRQKHWPNWPRPRLENMNG